MVGAVVAAATRFSLAEAHSLGTAHRRVHVLALASVAAVVPTDTSFWHFARTVVALRHLHLTESRSSAVVPAVGVLTVFLAVTVVVLTVKAGLSALVLCTFLMIHFAALLPNTVVTKAVWVFAVGLAVRIVINAVKAAAATLVRRRAAALALVTTALALVTTALATAFMAVSAVNPIEAVWILAVGFAIAVVVDVVEALFARFLASFGTAAGVVTASVAVRGAVFTARCAVLAVYPIEAVGVLAVGFPVAVVVLLVEAGFAGFLRKGDGREPERGKDGER